ncbi:hypothetical protein HGRIS_012595 [Hohenbuehelia grisea]|uniref:Xylose isomerase-like TIM barrel domain-containing protein n=1 Tax=Hohenbuehelia grisea TaxID=104357 RepID=A0ABR3ISU0_9AGAR
MVATRRSSSVAKLTADERPLKKTKPAPKRPNASQSEPVASTPVLESSKRTAEIPTAESLNPRPVSAWKVGAHVSAAGGVENALVNATNIGANAFALFIKSQRKWSSPPLKDTSISAFKARLLEYNYSPKYILPHGSYLINLGNPDAEKRAKSYDCFLDDLQRCEQLGLELYNLHPGSTVGAATLEESIAHIAACINTAHKATSNVTVVIENMAGAGNIIGSDFAHLSSIIAKVEDKSRIGVCLDTCHMFAAGYDIRTAEGWSKTMSDFDSIINLKYLRGMHLNDSKTELDSKRDRHENIGLGHIGLAAFHHILTDPRVQNIPLILETPTSEDPSVWAAEIKVLNQLSALAVPDAPDNSNVAYTELLGSIRSVSKIAEAKTGKSKTPKAKKVPQRKKRKNKEEDEDGDVSTDNEVAS